MRSSKVIGAVAAILAFLCVRVGAQAQGPWQQPARDLAAQIEAILGHGTARLMIRNISSLPVDQIPVIRKQLEQDLREHGVMANSAPNDTVIRVTLSEDQLDGLWVAEVIRGDDTQVVITRTGRKQVGTAANITQVELRKERFVGPFELDSLPCFPDAKPPLLAAAETKHGLIVLKQGCLLALDRSAAGFSDGRSFYHLNTKQAEARDSIGLVVATTDNDGFQVFLPGLGCSGDFSPPQDSNPPPGEGWSLNCRASDDPWPLTTAPAKVASPASSVASNPPPAQTPPPSPQIRAFYNAARNYFTGVVSPGMGVDLPPFYSAAVLQRASGFALLINSIDGKVLLASNGKLTAVNGTDDWGSDFALIQSGCGTGSQVIVSGADNSDGDTLRAYQIAGTVATPSSAPLQIEGIVTAIQTEPDGKSVLAVIRNAQNQYEVDRVTALCD